MRNPKRIPVILNELKNYWEKHPDMRFFQMLISLPLENATNDLFFYKDDQLLKSLENVNKENKNV